MKLISLREYVLRFDKPIGFYSDQLDYYEGQSNAMSYVISYANFISKKLELWMFVPCKLVEGVWVPIELPKCECQTEYDREGCSEKCYEYINSKNRVLFEGFEYNFKKEWFLNGTMILDEEFISNKKIEDLVKYNLELTPTAQKLIGL